MSRPHMVVGQDAINRAAPLHHLARASLLIQAKDAALALERRRPRQGFGSFVQEDRGKTKEEHAHRAPDPNRARSLPTVAGSHCDPVGPYSMHPW